MSQTKARILNAASDRYLEQGLKGLSMRQIAAEVGISAAAIYRHFENKQALTFALVGQAYESFSAALRASTSAKPSSKRSARPSEKEELLHARQNLQRLASAYVGFVIDQPQSYQLLFSSTHHLGSGENAFALPPHLQVAGREALWILVQAVEKAIEVGVIRKIDALEAARILWAQLHGVAALYLAQRLGVSEEAYAMLSNTGFEATLRGLSPL